ncbi:hypothetical protein [Rhodococcus sp. NCIMB 12038]|uniref:hypothetical protein n=1 Tax=Rhodococcus sp. NCIMB 12038 TaxID=933800 RepID=UPI00117A7C4A|nr:hypothetical protein [Rhodococcus sp. NCIMB 12038]
MTKNSAPKRAAREYMREHPGVAYRDALAIVTAEHAAAKTPYADLAAEFRSVAELLGDAVNGDMQLMEHELAVAEGNGLAFEVSIPEITEAPIDVVDVTHDLATLTVDEHEEFDGGTTIGEVRVEVDVDWEACVFRADYFGASSDVPWHVIDHDWNEHYVRVSGRLRAELTYHYVADHGSQDVDDITLQGMEQLSPTPTA